jgi:hypothetical protein
LLIRLHVLFESLPPAFSEIMGAKWAGIVFKLIDGYRSMEMDGNELKEKIEDE